MLNAGRIQGLVPLMVATLMATVSISAGAQTPGAIDTKLEAKRVVMKDGKEQFEAAATAKPGDIIEYVATYTNKGRGGVTNLEATLPIPANTELIIASITPKGAKASTGGSAYGDIPLKRKVRQPNGAEVEQEVAAKEYRSLRWYPGVLAGGASVAFTARVRVIDDRTAGAK